MQVQFSPKLTDENIREEALRLSIGRAMEEERTKLDSEGGHRRKRRKSITAQASPLVSSFASLSSTAGSQNQQLLLEGGEGKQHKIPPPQKG